MKEYLEKTLHQKIAIKEIKYLDDKLPLIFKGKYIIYEVASNNLTWIALKPKYNIGLVALRKDRNKVLMESKMNCALFLDSTSFYIKEKLLEEGIPFVLNGKQIYLPFIGCILSNENNRDIKPINIISFLTQKMILIAIYEKWNNVTISEASEKLGVTKMSISRCFDEIEYLNIDILSMKGKSRVITIPKDIKKLLEDNKHVLRNPVIQRYKLREDIKLNNKGGISALCEYSLISDNEYPTYVVTKKEIGKSGIRKMKQVLHNEEIGCVVLELGYFIDFKNKGIEDPISIALSINNDEADERINSSITKMMKEYVW